MISIKIVVLDADTLGNDISLEPISSLGSCEVYRNTAPDKVAERIRNAEVVIINKVKLNECVLKGADNLRIICVAATGFDNIDVSYCKTRGIAVCNVIGYSSHSVSQLTAAMVLSLSVNLKQFTEFVESGEYTKSGVANKLTPVYHELFGKVWGIVGFGNIGKEVARIAQALGCKVVVNKKTPIEEYPCLSIEELCKTADIITVHTPLNESTKGLISKDMLSIMKKDVILVNTARGAVFDEQALCEAVENGRIGAYGTDVYSVEPFSEDCPINRIKGYKNVCLTPHMAWGAYEARCRCVNEIAENIKAYYNNEIRNRVDLIKEI